jgi:hypothetical protein
LILDSGLELIDLRGRATVDGVKAVRGQQRQNRHCDQEQPVRVDQPAG